MSNQTYKKKLQRVGEDAAYTFKGLYKTADSLGFFYNILLIIPIILSISCLGFEAHLSHWIIKIVSCLSLIAVFILLFKKNDFSESKIEKYRKVANEYKEIYDEIECYYHDCDEKRDIEKKIDSIMNRISKLRQKTVELPINILGRFLSKRKINEEMDLGWIYSGKNKI
jgi:glucan phosphoethanolaminetransferase (alkaline phosphatase superfamily)